MKDRTRKLGKIIAGQKIIINKWQQKKKCLKRYPKNDIATRGKRKKKSKEKETARGQEKGNQLDALK